MLVPPVTGSDGRAPHRTGMAVPRRAAADRVGGVRGAAGAARGPADAEPDDTVSHDELGVSTFDHTYLWLGQRPELRTTTYTPADEHTAELLSPAVTHCDGRHVGAGTSPGGRPLYRLVTDCGNNDLSLSGSVDTPRALLTWFGRSQK
jgi:hypothetical protein